MSAKKEKGLLWPRLEYSQDQQTVTTETVTTKCFNTCTQTNRSSLDSLHKRWLQLQWLPSAGPTTYIVSDVHDEDEAARALAVVVPERPDLVLPADVPHDEVDVPFVIYIYIYL